MDPKGCFKQTMRDSVIFYWTDDVYVCILFINIEAVITVPVGLHNQLVVCNVSPQEIGICNSTDWLCILIYCTESVDLFSG